MLQPHVPVFGGLFQVPASMASGGASASAAAIFFAVVALLGISAMAMFIGLFIFAARHSADGKILKLIREHARDREGGSSRGSSRQAPTDGAWGGGYTTAQDPIDVTASRGGVYASRALAPTLGQRVAGRFSSAGWAVALFLAGVIVRGLL